MKPAPRKTEDPGPILADKAAVKAYAERIGTVEAWHKYGPASAPVLVVARIMPPTGKKTFRQFTPTHAGWVPRNMLERGRIPLYRIDEQPGSLIVVEGEKSAEAALAMGIPATTSAMGAGKAAESDWTPLAGRSITLWPDNDETGRAHMEQVREILMGLGCSVSIIDSRDLGLPEKGDIADLEQALGSAEAARLAALDIIAAAAPIDPSAVLSGWVEDVIAGRWSALPWPLKSTGRLSRACMPGTLSILCADPGAGKSFLGLYLASWWRKEGHRVSVRMLEDDLRVHLARLLAQAHSCAALTDDSWIRMNPEQARQAMALHGEAMRDAATWITAEDDEPPSLPDLCAWVETQAKGGARVIIVDPITATKPDPKPWIADFTAAMRLKRIARETGATIILTTHPRGVSKGPSLASMAGGTAWPRFAHSALWLERHDMSEKRLNTGEHAVCNRTLHIIKCRHGKGSGMQIGLLFDPETARFHEVGVLAPPDTGKYQGKQPKEPPPDKPNQWATPPSESEDAFQ
jgi:hypothetical protein